MAPQPPDRRRLDGRVALVTGVSRPIGIGATVALRLHDLGATVVATGWPPHDAEMPWGEQPLGSLPFEVGRHDLEDPAAPRALVDEAIERHGRLDIVVAVHARSSDQLVRRCRRRRTRPVLGRQRPQRGPARPAIRPAPRQHPVEWTSRSAG
jgi:NAD(P)-dependent dehydrogenase (short-subunit alcohol dehydrogenase family)